MSQTTHTPPLSLGFIGGSLRSAVGYAHFSACLMDNQWTLDAGCFSSDPELNRETSRAYGVAPGRVYDLWSEMLVAEKDRLDAIVVLTPTPMHREVVLACIGVGVPVICEKALATGSAAVGEIRQALDLAGGFLVVTYNYSGYPMVRELRQMIDAGELGTILQFQAEMPQEGYIRVDAQGKKPTPQPWRLSDAQVPMLHLDLGSHLHQLVHYLIKQTPLEVVSDRGSFGWFPDVTDNVTCLSRYSGGAMGQFWFSKSALGHRNGLRLRIYGSKASAQWYQAAPEELVLSYADGRVQTLDRAARVEVADLPRYGRFKAGHPAGFIEAFANLYCDIADCLRQYKSTGTWQSQEVFGAELAAEGFRLFDAMESSLETGMWQKVRVE